MALIIGLTGSIASGKSTVAKMFADYTIPVIDADIISRQVVEPGKPAYIKIIETFGSGIVEVDKTINRKKLGQIIFSDENKRLQLNQIVHPAVRKEMQSQQDCYLSKGEKTVVLDIPLLFESNLTKLVDKILVVYVDEDTQLKRLMNRDKSNVTEAKKRIASQMSVSKKAEMADAVINNSSTVESSKQQLKAILAEWSVIPVS